MPLILRDHPPETEEQIAARLKGTLTFSLGCIMSAILIDTFLW